MSTAAPPTEQPELASPRRLVDFVLRARTFGIIAVLGVLVLITALIQSRFVGGGEIRFILSQTALYALVAVGEAMGILTRNVDVRQIRENDAVLALSTGYGELSFGEGKYGGIQQVIVLANSGTRALSSVLQNVRAS